MIVDGNEVERADGTERCLGYGVDSDGLVTGRCALPSGANWQCPDATEDLRYVESMKDLPPVDDAYRPDPDDQL